MEATSKTWIRRDGSRADKTSTIRMTDEEKQRLDALRQRLGARTDTDVMRMALELLQTLMFHIETAGVVVEATFASVTQGKAAALPLLIEALEQHPDWFTDEREEMLSGLRSSMAKQIEAGSMERPQDACG